MSVDVDVLDLKRAVTAARDPDLNSDTAIRAADGTLRIQAYSADIYFHLRSYESDGQARISLDAARVAAMSAFLDAVAITHPLAEVNDEVDGDRPPPTYETHGFNWNRPLLRITSEGDSIVVEAEDPSDEIPHTETVRVPLWSFAALVEVAGGDLPGHGSFETRRGRLSCDYNRRAPFETVRRHRRGGRRDHHRRARHRADPGNAAAGLRLAHRAARRLRGAPRPVPTREVGVPMPGP